MSNEYYNDENEIENDDIDVPTEADLWDEIYRQQAADAKFVPLETIANGEPY